jgi:competence ComEA-like helix-hairpin-helix protein
MVFTAAERRLLTLLVFFLGLGYLLSAVRRCGGIGRAEGDSVEVRLEALDSSGIALGAPPAESLRTATVIDSAAAAGAPGGLFVAGYLDLNAADSLALLSLPGVGPAYASRILAYRRAHGAFTSVEELLQVKGIGPKRLERLRAFVAVRSSVGQ